MGSQSVLGKSVWVGEVGCKAEERLTVLNSRPLKKEESAAALGLSILGHCRDHSLSHFHFGQCLNIFVENNSLGKISATSLPGSI